MYYVVIHQKIKIYDSSVIRGDILKELHLNEVVRNNIKYYRIIRGLTQEKISELIGVNEKHYCNLENGRYNLTLDIIDRISRILNKEPWELLKEQHKNDEVPSRLDFYKNSKE